MRWIMAVVLVAAGGMAAAQDRAWIEASDRYSNQVLEPYRDLPREVFEGLQVLLDKRNSQARRTHALERLRRYAGMTPGTRPIAELARSRTLERADAGLVWPYRGEAEQELNNCER